MSIIGGDDDGPFYGYSQKKNPSKLKINVLSSLKLVTTMEKKQYQNKEEKKR